MRGIIRRKHRVYKSFHDQYGTRWRILVDFKQMVYVDNIRRQRKIYKDDDGTLYARGSRKIRFGDRLHEFYEEWQDEEINSILLGENDE